MMRIAGHSTPLRVCAAAAAILLAACWTSPTPRKVALADQPRGATVTLHMTDGVVHSGELLAVRDSSLVLLLGERIAVAPLSAVESVTFAPEGTPMSASRPETLLQARSAARFPYGITPTALNVLLQHAGQDIPIELRAGVP
jgi:hypothetical protein